MKHGIPVLICASLNWDGLGELGNLFWVKLILVSPRYAVNRNGHGHLH